MSYYDHPLGPIDPAEIKVLKFPFAQELNGATIASITSITPSVYSGADPTPAARAYGAPAISGTDVLQRMAGLLDGVVYKWRAQIIDSAGNVHVVADTVRGQVL